MSDDARQPTRTIGIDPGTARLGYAVIETERGKPTLLACGVITTPKGLAMHERRLSGMKCRLEPEPAFGRQIRRHADIGNQEFVLEGHAGKSQTQ